MGPDVSGDLAYQFTALSKRDDGFQWPDASEFILMYHVLDCHIQKPRQLN